MKVRIKKTPRTGDQRDYSLTTHRPWSPTNTEDPNAVQNTISGVPRQMANIEAEGGETVLGDINNDGNIEHMTITGKRHTEGGVPLNVPPGSFIFSDTRKLKIKDRAVLDHFGMGGRKDGYTPAEIAKRYQLNDFMQKVNDPNTDPMTRRTAERMLTNNMNKLAQLAAYQEGMKGNTPPAVSQQMLPDQGQTMAEDAFAYSAAQMDPAEMMMRYGGGIPKMQTAGSVPPKIGTTYYVNGQPIKLDRYEDDSISDYFTPNFMADPGGVYFKDKNNEEFYLPYDQFKNLRSKGKVQTEGSGKSSWWTSDGLRQYEFSTTPGGSKPALKVNNNTTFHVGDVITTKDGTFKVSNPQAAPHPTAKYSAIEVTGPGGKKQLISVKGILDDVNKGMAEIRYAGTPAATAASANNTEATTIVYDAAGNAREISIADKIPAGYTKKKPTAAPVVTTPANTNRQVTGTPKTLPKTQPKSNVKVYESFEEAVDEKWNELQDRANGGQLYQEGGQSTPPKYKYDAASRRMVPVMQTAGTTPTGEREFVETIQLKDGRKGKRVTKGNFVTTYDDQGKQVAQKQIEQDYGTYSVQDIDKWKQDGIDVTLPSSLQKTYDKDKVEGRQGIRATGTYGTQDYYNPENAADFKTRQKRFVDANPNFDPKKDAGVFQDWYNKDIYDQALAAGYSPEEATGYVNKFGFVAGSVDPNDKDGKFGRYTWSRPAIKINPKAKAPQTVYRCPDCIGVQVPADYAITASDFTSQAACQTACAQKSTPPPPAAERDNDFWIQDKIAIANAGTMDRFYGEPAMFQMNPSLYDPQLEEYSAKNAALQSDASLAMSNINASADPTTARANIAAISGQLGQAGINEIANIQNRNVNTTNQVAADRARLKNDANVRNLGMRKQFYDETQAYGQNLVNSSNMQRTNLANAMNHGFQGLQARNMMRAIYPMYDIDPSTGAKMFIDGEDFTDNTTYTTSPAANSGASLPALIEHYKKQLSSVLGPEEAAKQAVVLARDDMKEMSQSRNISQRALLQNNPMAAMSGMTGGNPFGK